MILAGLSIVRIAQLVLFLCSEAASYISGGEYTVDGAMSASL